MSSNQAAAVRVVCMYQHFNCGVANLAILRKHSIAACWTDARRILRDNKNL